jgi:effector-binding domain-containing protein
VADAGGAVGSAPFGWYHGMPTDTVDVSVGFPVVGDVHPLGGGVGLLERPAVRAAVGVHVGPYDGLPQTYARMQQWVAEQGLAPTGEMWEEYLSPPEGDPSTWRTRVVIPVQ